MQTFLKPFKKLAGRVLYITLQIFRNIQMHQVINISPTILVNSEKVEAIIGYKDQLKFCIKLIYI